MKAKVKVVGVEVVVEVGGGGGGGGSGGWMSGGCGFEHSTVMVGGVWCVVGARGGWT